MVDLLIDHIGGHCPVQAEGEVNGKPFYFRSRGSKWTMNIGGSDIVMAPEWSYSERYGTGPYDAGYMTVGEAVDFINAAAARYDEHEKASMDWQPIETCPEGVEVWTRIWDELGVRNVQLLVKRTRIPGKTGSLFWYPDGSMYVYYTPTHWKAK